MLCVKQASRQGQPLLTHHVPGVFVGDAPV